MNFTLDSCIATLILAITLVYFTFSCLSAIPRCQHHYDDSYTIIGRLLRYYDLQYAVYTNNSKLVEAIINSITFYEHSYYLAVIDPATNSTLIEVGSSELKSYCISVTLPGWNGTISPKTIMFRIGVRG